MLVFAVRLTTVISIILDGEMLVWDPVSERNLPFGTLKTAALGTFQSCRRLETINKLLADRSKKEHNPRPCCELVTLLLRIS